MNIPPGLKQIREANTTAVANALLAAGWTLITVEGIREGNLLYLLGWCREETPLEPTRPERTSGNLAENARQ